MRGVSVGFGGGVASFPLTLGEYFDAHHVPGEARPRWIRLLAHLESVFKEHVTAATHREEESDAKPRARR